MKWVEPNETSSKILQSAAPNTIPPWQCHFYTVVGSWSGAIVLGLQNKLRAKMLYGQRQEAPALWLDFTAVLVPHEAVDIILGVPGHNNLYSFSACAYLRCLQAHAISGEAATPACSGAPALWVLEWSHWLIQPPRSDSKELHPWSAWSPRSNQDPSCWNSASHNDFFLRWHAMQHHWQHNRQLPRMMLSMMIWIQLQPRVHAACHSCSLTKHEYVFLMKSILKHNAKANTCTATLFPEKCPVNLVDSYSKCLLGTLLSKSWRWVSSLLCSSSFCTLSFSAATPTTAATPSQNSLSKSKEVLLPYQYKKDNTTVVLLSCTITHKFCCSCSPDSEEGFVFKPFCLL